MKGFNDLIEQELENVQGGWLIFVAGACVVGIGYVKEKLDSGQW
ncbi:class IIb bacteriocin, lactobin A/cerein 7B family [Belliella sp. DSM 107340]|uniref:Class IIb bacteriocin, lactobin A/cerein 7B family n=1 Tax=Belliella calami TaxID=2923436 RepID=A0ABS9URZ9_9BACT|nr:class IIb bacteriocin, lactobin A/cerein 7B family [Belliella calami]MCH7399038.1 class IIb bacteriocin, lactobin A/cerein 7B family [Belliella calami]